jgi:hypothetical protein
MNPYFFYDISNSNIIFNIENKLELIENYDWLNNKAVKYITIIIWLSLTSYIKNNPLKVVGAYYYAHYLFMYWGLNDYSLE